MSIFSAIDQATVPDGVWLTVAELSRRKGISRQSVSERISRLEKDGLIETRKDGRSRLVELASFDRAVGQTGDAFREQGAATKRSGEDTTQRTSGALRDAQSDRARYEAQLKALDLAERTGLLLPMKGEHGIETALMRVSDKIVRDLEAPMTWAADLMEAAREGEPALRRVLREKIRMLRATVAEHMMQLAGEGADAERAGIQIDIDFDGDA